MEDKIKLKTTMELFRQSNNGEWFDTPNFKINMEPILKQFGFEDYPEGMDKKDSNQIYNWKLDKLESIKDRNYNITIEIEEIK